MSAAETPGTPAIKNKATAIPVVPKTEASDFFIFSCYRNLPSKATAHDGVDAWPAQGTTLLLIIKQWFEISLPVGLL
jgi:hypothetical protein